MKAQPLANSAPDGGLLLAASVLAAVGLVMVYSATAPLHLGRVLPPHFLRHLGATGLGIAVATLALRVPLPVWRRAALPLWVTAVALLAATLVVGVRVNNARRWFDLGGFVFQPGELAKLATLVAMAALLAQAPRRSPRALAPVLGLAVLPAGLLVLQPDTGNAVLLLVLAAALLFVAGTPLRVLVAPGAIAAAVLMAAVALRPYALARVRAFLDPWGTSQAEGFQIVQSFVAFGRGGALGVGLGDGRQKLHYLPEAHTDFVLSVVAEELGLVGVALVLGAFAALWLAGCRIAGRARDRFALLAVFGMTSLLVVPAALNAAVVMGLVPPKGLTLPFLSYGRSSLLVCFLALGLLLRAGRREAAPTPRAVASAKRRRSWRR